ncbi:MAG: cytochrome C biogenesis protein CcdA [Candidatus Omnitrophica bacterium CG11_big_fil_rev_8_21_14_0_20_42_13]|uniref:Cytochrome C biogenesis protein CcdA n=1 Tax=Candidatus Ghiorseimicrobium undicola TaxID=1974746 RepID=A0A2H0LZI2_9BACT|nr:MAG: cytochrome C biogenesis protein CcdA [Candidatus Omnitrophica bacterium CG11_big_fil_rev_8_21_14_0_20_42_13]
MHIMIFVTAKDVGEAEKIARHLLDNKLAACVNIINQVKSLFWWEGKLDNAAEVLMIIKSREDLFDRLQNAVKSLHSYDVPEIIALPIVKGDKDYLNWIDKSVLT